MLFSYGCLSHKKETIQWGTGSINNSSPNTNNLTYANLTYTQDTFNFVYGSEITPIIYQDNISQIDECLISDSLPLGLQLNQSDCKITGSPVQAMPATSFTIKIKSGNTIFSKILTIEVLSYICSNASITVTSSDPIFYNGKYIICNANQLKKITEKTGIIASIHSDINLGSITESLGSLSNIVIEGNNHTIYGEISDVISTDVGLFRSIRESRVQNLNLKLKVTGSINVGILAGRVKNSNIINILIDPNSEILGFTTCSGLLFGVYDSDINFMQYLNVIALGKLNNASGSKSGLIACIPSAYLSSYSFDFTNSFYDGSSLGAVSNNLNTLDKSTASLKDPNVISLDSNYWDHTLGGYPQLKPLPSILINF